ncbi:MAG: hypothetical protein QNJ94_05770, partial [Alphaproteobacteria bacterium]|nr:hypothetical protein [Alphaproteobacteria bacterium]
LLPTLGAAAEEGIPNTPIICAATEVAQCSETGTCAQGSAVRFNLPVFLRIDLQDKVVESVLEGGARRTSKIRSVDPRSDDLVIQGADAGTVWIATIQRSSGRMTASSARQGHGFVVFGSCTTL